MVLCYHAEAIMEIVIGLIINVVLCSLIAAGAKNRGRSGVGFFFLSFCLSPIVGGVALLCLGEKKPV